MDNHIKLVFTTPFNGGTFMKETTYNVSQIEYTERNGTVVEIIMKSGRNYTISNDSQELAKSVHSQILAAMGL